MPDFTPDRALLNPRFDGYKFSPLEYEDVASRYPLEHKLTQTNVSGRAPLSFQEVQSRVTHNHLAVCSQTRRAAYVDAELRVVGFDLDEVSICARCQTLLVGREATEEVIPPDLHRLRNCRLESGCIYSNAHQLSKRPVHEDVDLVVKAESVWSSA